MTDDYGATQIVNKDPRKDFNEAFYYEWQQDHLVKELKGKERLDFCNSLCDYLKNHINDTEITGGITSLEVDAYREFFKKEY